MQKGTHLSALSFFYYICKKFQTMLEHILWGNTVLDLLISLAIAVGGFFIAKLIYLIFTKIFGKIASRTESNLDDLLVENFRAPFMFAAVLGTIRYALERLELSETVANSIDKAYTILIVINFTWAVSRLATGVIADVIERFSKKKDKDINKGTTSMLQNIASTFIWALGILVAMNNVGIEIGTLIAGLGIGGVAVALAAQDTIKNLFGGFMLIFDRPFNLGDRVKFNGLDGYVRQIGLRSLRIETLDNRMVTIPNSIVVDSSIENLTSEPSTRIQLTLGLTYDTTPEQMERAMELLRNLPKSVKGIEEKTVTTFMQYGDFALQILFIYYIKKDGDFYQTQSDVNMEILREFNAAGLDFAFPTQTIYTKQA